MKIGKTIIYLRKQKGFKQKDFAALCGITPSYLSQIESDLKEPNLSIIKIICDKVSIPLPIFLLMTLEEDDIQEGKKEKFELIKPVFDTLIKEIYS